MKKIIALLLSVVIIFSLTSCSSMEPVEENTQPSVTDEVTTEPTTLTTTETTTKPQKTTFASEILSIPDGYLQQRDNVKSTELYSYKHNGHDKHAAVYLPPDYDENKQYDIVYISAGARSDHTAFFDNPGDSTSLKRIFDSMIISGEVKPFICVNISFFPTDDHTLNDSNINSLCDDFNEELEDYILPGIETKYSTYAKDGSEESLVKSREHRAFIGFSMGASLVFDSLSRNLKYFKYFGPISGEGWEDDYPSYEAPVGISVKKELEQNKLNKFDFFIYLGNGEGDTTYQSTKKLIDRLKTDYSDTFVFTDSDKSQGNITVKMMENISHKYVVAYRYFYNAILAFFPTE